MNEEIEEIEKIIASYKAKQALQTKLTDDFAQTILHRAKTIKDPALFQALVKATQDKKATLNIQDVWGGTPLYIAARMGAVEVVECLLQHGADPNKQCFDKQTALQIAIKTGHNEVVACLLKYKVNVTLQDRFGNTALHMAMQRIYGITSEVLNCLIQAAKDQNALHLLDRSGASALHSAIMGNMEAYQRLLEAGSNPYVSGLGGYVLAAGVPVIDTESIDNSFRMALTQVKQAFAERRVVFNFSLLSLLLPEAQYRYRYRPRSEEPSTDPSEQPTLKAFPSKYPPYIDAFGNDWLEASINSWLECEEKRRILLAEQPSSATASKVEQDLASAVADFDNAVAYLAGMPEPKKTIFIHGLRFLQERLDGDQRQAAIGELLTKLDVSHPLALTSQAASSVPVLQSMPASRQSQAATSTAQTSGIAEALHPLALTSQAASSVPVSQSMPVSQQSQAATSSAPASGIATEPAFFTPLPTAVEMHTPQRQHMGPECVQCKIV